MASILKNLRLLSDPSRVRILLLLEREELSVTELQEILAMGQSRISTHLAQLKQAGLVEDRRIGKSILYRFMTTAHREFGHLLRVLRDAATEIPEAADDSQALKLVLGRRRDRMRAYFDGLAGKFGRHYVPGSSWKGLAEMLLARQKLQNSWRLLYLTGIADCVDGHWAEALDVIEKQLPLNPRSPNALSQLLNI